MTANYLTTLPAFASFFGMGLLLLALFWGLYTLATPHAELELIRAGNVSAAVMLAGAMIGFALPVAVAMARSEDLMRLAQWGSVALIVQFGTYLALRLMHRGLHEAIEQDRLSVALWAATLSLCAGLLNAGAQLI
jgi:putative membrane protein